MLRLAQELYGALVSKRDEIVAKMQAAAKELYEVAGEGACIAIVVGCDDHTGVLTNTAPMNIKAFVDSWVEGAERSIRKQN